MRASERDVADHPALLTDAYELTMAAAYFAAGMHGVATFSFFVRGYPLDRGYFVAAGLEDVVQFLTDLRFHPAAVEHLRRHGGFSGDFLAFLETVRFTGDVWAVPEGSVCFADEPLLEITAPIIEAQLVETFVINQLHLQTLIATKAARCVTAAAGRPLIDFALRRAHGTDAGMKVARASYLAGFAGTSNVLAEMRYGIPAFGTMAHAFVEAFDDELEAFRAFARAFPGGSTLLVDTYDTLAGVAKAAQVGRELAARGERLGAVRLDSGDLAALSRGARHILDDAGLGDVEIFASGGLNEYAIADLVAAGAPIDGFGVGTEMGVSGDAPWLDCAYKLVEYAGTPRLKLSAKKETLVGRKQVWRVHSDHGPMVGDVIALREEAAESVARSAGADARRLVPRLQPVMRAGRVIAPLPPLAQARDRCAAETRRLPEATARLRNPARYPVTVSPELRAAQDVAVASIRGRGAVQRS